MKKITFDTLFDSSERKKVKEYLKNNTSLAEQLQLLIIEYNTDLNSPKENKAILSILEKHLSDTYAVYHQQKARLDVNTENNVKKQLANIEGSLANAKKQMKNMRTREDIHQEISTLVKQIRRFINE